MTRAALVTGGARGLGREAALALGRGGYAICVAYESREAAAAEAARNAGPGSFAARADVASRADLRALALNLRDRFGRLDAIVQCAAVTADALMPRIKEDDWDRLIDVNLTGCYNVIAACLPLMVETGGGHIVNVSSRSGIRGNAGQAAYAASKAGVIGLTLSLARELGPLNVRVNALLPGYMPTGMGLAAPAAMERARRESPIARLTDPAEAAALILWLVGTQGVTGQTFIVDSRP